MSDRLYSVFNCAVNPSNELVVSMSVDGDVHLATLRSDGISNASIRIRTYAGGGSNIILRHILAGMVSKVVENSSQMTFFNVFDAMPVPNDYKEFLLRCDDNPGSHLKVAIAENAIGFQTNCHDEEADYASGGLFSRQGEGAMVWIPKYRLPNVYKNLIEKLVEGKVSQKESFGRDSPFRFYMPKAQNV